MENFVSHDGEEADDILAQVLPPAINRSVAPASRSFQPWHKPRKQWVRKNQWEHEVEEFIQTKHFPEGARVLRYIGLPGDDLLDIRILQRVCERNAFELRYVGMNDLEQGSQQDLQLNIVENEVKSLNNIDKASLVLRERFERIADEKSFVSVKVCGNGPYHVINLDLCDSVAFRPQDAGPTYIDALARIVQHQLKNASSWLLFLTTRVGPGKVNTVNLQALISAIRDNILANEEFEAKVSDILCQEGEVLSAKLENPNELDGRSFKNLFCIGFGKWLLSYIKSALPACELTLGKSCYYSVFRDNPDMLSLVFKCNMITRAPIDRYEMVKSPALDHCPTEESMAMDLLEQVGSIFDLDELLRGDELLRESLVKETEDVLRELHYQVDDADRGYRAWLTRAGC